MTKVLPFLLFILSICVKVSAHNRLFFSVENEGHYAPIRKILVDERRHQFLTISEDKTVGFWDSENFKNLTFKHFNQNTGRHGVYYAATFSPDTNFLLLAGNSGNEQSLISVVNLNSRTIATSISIQKQLIVGLHFKDNNELIILDDKGKLTSIVLDKDWNIIKTNDLPFKHKITSFIFDHNHALYFGTDLGKIVYALNNEKPKILRKHYSTITSMASHGAVVLTGAQDHRVNMYIDGSYHTTVAQLDHPVSHISISPDGKTAIVGEMYSGIVRFVSLEEESVISKSSALDNTIFSSNFLTNYNGTYGVVSGGTGHEIDILNPANGGSIKRLGNESAVHSSLYSHENKIYFSDKPNAREYQEYFDLSLFKITKAKSAVRFEQENKGKLKTPSILKIGKTEFEAPAKQGRILSWYTSDKFVFVGTDFDLLVFDHKGNLVQTIEAHLRGIRALTTISLDSSNYLVTSGEDELIKFWKIGDTLATEAFLELYINDLREWVLWSSMGYFDSSEQGSRLVGFQTASQQKKFTTLDQFFDVLYKPDHIKESLYTGKSIEQILQDKNERVIDLSDIKGASYVTIDDFYTIKQNSNGSESLIYPTPTGSKYTTKEAEIDLKLTAVDGGAGIKEISILRDGKLIALDNQFAHTKTGESFSKTYKVYLLPGENKIEVFAENFQKRKSTKMRIDIECTGDIQASSNLYAFVIGINKYKNEKNNLNYAYDDAKAFATKIAEVSSGIFKEVNVIQLYDEDANKNSISDRFNTISKTAKPNDVFVFYFAGHGVINTEASDAEYFLIPHEVTQLYGNDEMLKQQAIAASQLKSYLAKIEAQKQLILLDACHSGGAIKTLSTRGGAEEKAIFQLARSSGIVLISASGTEQFATEFKELGHGVFTYTLLQALEGNADGAGGDKKITVSELKAYMEDNVPQISKKYGGKTQYPTGFSSGQDFPIGVVK